MFEEQYKEAKEAKLEVTLNQLIEKAENIDTFFCSGERSCNSIVSMEDACKAAFRIEYDKALDNGYWKKYSGADALVAAA